MRLLTVAVLLFASTLHAQTAPVTDWKPLQFLVGTWQAKSSGQAQSMGSYTFETELNGHVLVRRTLSSKTVLAAAGYDTHHEDVLYVYQDAPDQPYRAIYFDNEGHVIHYTVTVPLSATAVFTSDTSQPGPQFRLTYTLQAGNLNGKFEVAAPGQSAFQTYLSWSGPKQGSEQSAQGTEKAKP